MKSSVMPGLGATRRRSRPRIVVIAAAIALSACASRDPAPAGGAPAFVPSSAAPPVLDMSSNELVGPVWQWQRTDLPGSARVVAAAPDRYTLSFQGGGRVLLRADCNRGSGAYEVNDTTMKLGPAALTRMGCPPDSQDGEFLRQLARVARYTVAGGELVLTLSDGGTMRFRRAQ
jgi:heat shock protein HslJ